MDQGVLEKMKRNYWKTILKKLLEVDDDLILHLKKINMLEVVEYISDAWNRVDEAAWCHLCPNENVVVFYSKGQRVIVCGQLLDYIFRLPFVILCNNS